MIANVRNEVVRGRSSCAILDWPINIEEVAMRRRSRLMGLCSTYHLSMHKGSIVALTGIFGLSVC